MYNPKKYILALQLKSNKNCIYNNKININKDDFRHQYGCQSYYCDLFNIFIVLHIEMILETVFSSAFN